MSEERQWSLIYATTQPIEAEMVKQMLMSNGIEAVVINKRDSSYLTFGEAELYVEAENATKAKTLIETQEP